MAKVWDITWPFERVVEGGVRRMAEPLAVTLDAEGYAAFKVLQGSIFRDGAFVVDGEERDRVLTEMDTLVRLYDGFPGARMLTAAERAEHDGTMTPEATTETLKLMRDLQAKGIPFPKEAFEAVADGQTALLDLVPEADPEPPAWSTPSTVAAPESAASRLPDFDGETYWRALDHERLGKQLLRVGRQMADGEWHTLAGLAETTGDPEASVSARIRDLRKRKFGGHTVNRERMEGGLWRYRLVREQFATPWDDEEVQAA